MDAEADSERPDSEAVDFEEVEAEAAVGVVVDAGPMSRSSMTLFFSVISTTALGSIGLPTTVPTRPMSVYWRRKFKESDLRQLCAVRTGT